MSNPVTSKDKIYLDQGFTLMELIVVMIILALSMSLFLGLNFRFKDKLLLQATARKVRSFLISARSQAQLQARDNLCVYHPQSRLLRQNAKSFIKLPDKIQILTAKESMAMNPSSRLTSLGPSNAGSSGKGIPLVLFFPDGGATNSIFYLKDRSGNRIMIHVDPLLGDVQVGEDQ